MDSKVSCTRIRLDRRLNLEEFVTEACAYMVMHPMAPINNIVRREAAMPCSNHFVIVRCEEPMARGREGEVIGLLKENPKTGSIYAGNVFTIGDQYKQDTWYNAFGEEVIRDA